MLFSSAVNVLALAVTGVRKSVNDAYKSERKYLQVSVVSVYDKLKGTEVPASREIVRDSAARSLPVIDALKTRGAPLLPNYRTKILDGNHLAATEHRIKETRNAIAELYRNRWKTENAFQELGQSRNGEINTLCYPRAALLAFCIALYTYKVLSVLKHAMRAAFKKRGRN